MFHVLGKFWCPQSASKGLPKQTPRDQPRQAFRRPSNSLQSVPQGLQNSLQMALKVLPKASKTLARRLLTSLGVIRPAKPGALKGLQIKVKVPSKYSSRPPNQSLLISLTLYLSFLFFPVLFSSCLFFSLSLSRSLFAGLLRFFSRSRFPFPGLTGFLLSPKLDECFTF